MFYITHRTHENRIEYSREHKIERDETTTEQIGR